MLTFYINCGSGFALTSAQPDMTNKFLISIDLPEGVIMPILVSQINGLISSARATPDAINATVVQVNFGS